MNLRQLISALPSAQVTGETDVEIRDAAYDSRRVEPGFLFVAVPKVGGDAQSGGYQHIRQVIEAGAAAVVAQLPHEVPEGFPFIVVPDTRAALADISAEFFRHPSRQMSLFAVTGTDGKTTTTYLLDGLLSAAGLSTGLLGTVETKIGNERQFNADRMTTPESLDLQRLFRTMSDRGVTHASLEASSHALALQRLRATTFTASALTNITGDHVEFHGSLEAYFEAKASLFTEVSAQKPAILNRDDPSFGQLRSRIPGPVISYGLSSEADIHASDLRPNRSSTSFIIHGNGESADTAIPIPGSYNVSNALAAVGLALQAGIPLREIARTLPHVEPPPGRLQQVDAGQSFDVLIDYAHTSNAFRTVLSALRATTGAGRLIAVFGATGDRDHAKRPEFARIAQQNVNYFIITNEDPFGEDADAIIDEVASGVDPALEGTLYEREPDRAEAITRAISLARPGDTVVILGKGHEQSIVVNGHKEPWSDSRVAREALEALS